MAALLMWVFSDMISIYLTIALVLIFIPLLPWVVVRSMAFRNHNSAYRNLRFAFHGSYGGAFPTCRLPTVNIPGGGIANPWILTSGRYDGVKWLVPPIQRRQ